MGRAEEYSLSVLKQLCQSCEVDHCRPLCYIHAAHYIDFLPAKVQREMSGHEPHGLLHHQGLEHSEQHLRGKISITITHDLESANRICNLLGPHKLNPDLWESLHWIFFSAASNKLNSLQTKFNKSTEGEIRCKSINSTGVLEKEPEHSLQQWSKNALHLNSRITVDFIHDAVLVSVRGSGVTLTSGIFSIIFVSVKRAKVYRFHTGACECSGFSKPEIWNRYQANRNEFRQVQAKCNPNAYNISARNIWNSLGYVLHVNLHN